MRKSNEVYRIIKDTKKNDLLRIAREVCIHGHSLLAHPSCFRQNLKIEEKIGILDIEASNLKADFGYMFSYCIKELDGEVIKNKVTSKEIRSCDWPFDKRLLRDFINDAMKFTKLVTYYGTKFDLPFLRTRALTICKKYGYELDYPKFQEIKHYDLYYTVKHKFLLRRNGLRNICDALGIESKEHPLKDEVWNKALTGDEKSLEYILIHNEEDVISTEKVYKELKDYVGPKNNSI